MKGKIMKFRELAETILEKVGGTDNIISVTHCLTRLRFNLKDESKADKEGIKASEGVVGVVSKAGQFQVIIGADVPQVYQELIKLTGDQFAGGEVAADEDTKKDIKWTDA